GSRRAPSGGDPDPRRSARNTRAGGVLAARPAEGFPGGGRSRGLRAGDRRARRGRILLLGLRRDRPRGGRRLPRMRSRLRGMSPARTDVVLLDAGGVLLDLDYAFLKRLLDARQIPTSVAALAESESIARTAIDQRVREGGRSSEAWRD